MSWSNYKFYTDEIDARERAGLLLKMFGVESTARVIKLPNGGYMVQLQDGCSVAFNANPLKTNRYCGDGDEPQNPKTAS